MDFGEFYIAFEEIRFRGVWISLAGGHDARFQRSLER